MKTFLKQFAFLAGHWLQYIHWEVVVQTDDEVWIWCRFGRLTLLVFEPIRWNI